MWINNWNLVLDITVTLRQNFMISGSLNIRPTTNNRLYELLKYGFISQTNQKSYW